MQSAPLLIGQIIAFVIGDEIDDCSFRQVRRFVKNKPPLLDTCQETAHELTVRVPWSAGKPFTFLRKRPPTLSIWFNPVGDAKILGRFFQHDAAAG